MRVFLGFAFLISLAACPGNGKKESSALPPCSKFGDSCEFAPGKLGSCVVKDGCTEGNCFTCQSQH